MSATAPRVAVPKAPVENKTVLPPARVFADRVKTEGPRLKRRDAPPSVRTEKKRVESTVVNGSKRNLSISKNRATGTVIQFAQPEDTTRVAPPVITLNGSTRTPVNKPLSTTIASTAIRSSGSPLPVAVQNPLSRSFSIDLTPIRVHTDARAQSMAKMFKTRAFVYGNHIFLGPGESPNDLRVMSHEVAHVVQQSSGAVLQHFSTSHSDPFEAEAERASAAAMRGSSFNVQQRTSPRPQGFDLSLPDISIPDPWDWLAGKANAIPGFRMFTIVLGVNPINGSHVDRSGANILRALVEFMPGGFLIVEALDNHGIFEKAGAFIEAQFNNFGLAADSVVAAVKDFVTGLDLPTDLFNPGSTWERAKRIFTEPIDRIIAFASGLVNGIIEIIKDAILKPIAKLAEGTEGYNLLKGVLGYDPITNEPVTPSAETLLGPLLKMIGLGDVWQKMQEANAIPRAWQWFQSTISALVGFVSEIPDLFLAAFKALTIEDIILVPRAFAKLAAVFGGFMSKFVSWGIDAMFKLLEIVFDVVHPGAFGYVKKTGAALKSILQDPLPFVGNLVKAAKLGFQNFGGNFLTHLKKGLIEWLTGSLQGVYIPKALTLPEFGKLALSVLGITWAQIRAKIVKALGPHGETIMQVLENVFDIVKALVTGGPAAAWEVIKDKLTGLKDQIVSGITSMVVEAVVTKAIPKLLAMFIPGAGFISAIVSIYDTIMVFVNKISKIIQVVTAFINSIVAIASGNIGAAASKVETILAGLLSLAISFLAGFAGLGKVADKVMGIVNKVRAMVDKALDTAINFIISKAKGLFKSLFGGKDKKPDTRTDAEKMRDLRAAVGEGTALAKSHADNLKGLKGKLAGIAKKYKLTKLAVVDDGEVKHHLVGEINPNYQGDPFTADDLEALLAKIPPAAREDVRQAVQSAVDKQQKVQKIFDTAKARGIIRPNKTMSLAEDVTISGWGTLDETLKKLAKGRKMELSQSVAEVHKYVTDNAAGLAKYGYSTRPFIFDPKYAPGAYFKSHAEKQSFIAALNALEKATSKAKKDAIATLGVTRPVCPQDCFPFFKAVADMEGKTIVLADPLVVWVFSPGQVIRKNI